LFYLGGIFSPNSPNQSNPFGISLARMLKKVTQNKKDEVEFVKGAITQPLRM
jgi:tRNA (Thr-GGU) A37 N-methylase